MLFANMKIFFCSDCGGYTLWPSKICDECPTALQQDSWVEITEEELQQLEYMNDFDLPENMPTWEYEVIKLKSEYEESSLQYIETSLKIMGSQGWELVKITSIDNTTDSFGIFKRMWEEKETS